MLKCGVEITSFRGYAVNAIHYYGEVWSYDGDAPPHKRIWKQILEYPMSIKQAKEFNEHDGTFPTCRYRAGDMTGRFEEEDDLRNLAIKTLTEKYGKDIIVYEGSVSDCEPKQIYPKG